MKRYIKCKCSVCNKRKTKSFYNLDGESKPICFRCMWKLAGKNIEEDEEKRKAHENNLARLIDISILSAIIVLLVGLIAFSQVLSNLNNIANLFLDREKATYFILFFLVNYFTGLFMGRLTQDSPLWFKVASNILMTFVTTLVSCVVVIRKDFQMLEGYGLLIFISTIILSACCLVIFILNHKGICKKKYLYKISFLLFLLAAVIEIIAYSFRVIL